jgi:hypothetical protein
MQTFARRVVGDDRQSSTPLEDLADGITVIGRVGNQQLGCQIANQFERDWRVTAMTGADD